MTQQKTATALAVVRPTDQAYTIPVVKNVPMPATHAKRLSVEDYPFDRLTPGASFWAPLPDGMKLTNFRNRLRMLGHGFCRTYGLDWTFVTAEEDDGARLWRRS